MKKLIAILLSVLMLVAFAACTNTEDPTEPATDEVTEEIVTDEATEEATEEATDEATEEATDEATEEGSDVAVEDSAAVAALSAVWTDVVADEALIAAFGAADSEELAGYFAGGDSFVMGAPAAYSMDDAEVLTSMFGISAEEVANVTEVATIMHAMNGNNLTAAAYTLAEGADAAAFADSLKTGITSMQFLCGAPEQLIIAEADGVVIAAFGGADIITAFNTALSANGTVLVEDAIG